MAWLTSLIPIILALYGWWLINRLTKRREAYDLYQAVLSLLEQLDTEGREAWKDSPENLDEYTERRLASKAADFEQRLELIWQYYPARQLTKITGQQITDLRWFMTASPGLVELVNTGISEPRSVTIHRLTATMHQTLLAEIYSYINRNPWLP